MTEIKRWTDKNGNKWACGALDHSMFCRLCQPVDKILDVILDGVNDGLYKAKIDQDGKFSFKLTPKGIAGANQLLNKVIKEEVD